MHVDTLLRALLCGHFVGDFMLQTSDLAARKARRVGWLLLHVLVVVAVTGLLIGDPAAWPLLAALFAVHLLVDLLKRRFVGGELAGGGEGAARAFRWFLFDQALHVTAIVLLWYAARRWGEAWSYVNPWRELLGADFDRGLVLVSGLALCVWGVGVVLTYQMASFAAALPSDAKSGLPRAGRTIGMFERLLVFMFVLAGRPEGVGFVVAAKSVFRIGDLTGRDQRYQAEYIMIGTLQSFAYALAVAFATSWLMARVGGG
jgi:hypothetical protein